MAPPTKNLIFWGAGAAIQLGMRATAENANFIRSLAGRNHDANITNKNTEPGLALRVREALGASVDNSDLGRAFETVLCDLLTILGDNLPYPTKNCDFGVNHFLYIVESDAEEAISRHWLDQKSRIARILELRQLYDWPALRIIIQLCPGVWQQGFLITDLFNVLDMHIASGHGFKATRYWFITPQRVIAARAALQLLLQTMFYVDYHVALQTRQEIYAKYYDFALEIGRRAQRQGVNLANDGTPLEKRAYYQNDTGFVSLNYDPLGLWAQFKANKDLNSAADCPHIGLPATPLRIFHDLGHFMAVRTIGDPEKKKELAWYPLNEASAQRLNDTDHSSGRRVRLTKYLLPHGCLCWRECPDCGKLSCYFGDEWGSSEGSFFGRALIPPPPLKGFVDVVPGSMPNNSWSEENNEWSKGAVDARACVHCKTTTYSHHAPLVMQTNYKRQPPPFLAEIERELRICVQSASHIIMMGYSLPPDDVTFRAFFSARKHRTHKDQKVRCTVVGYLPGVEWVGPDDLNMLMHRLLNDPTEVVKSPYTTLKAACDIFDGGNVRFYGGGVPNVFLDESGKVTRNSVDHLLEWNS